MTSEEMDKNWDGYFIEGTDVLKNKLGITDKEELKEKEIEITFLKNLELMEKPIDLDFGVEHLREIHRYLFGDIYYFAGENRNVDMRKGNSYFAPSSEIDRRLEMAFLEFENELKDVYSKYDFASHLANIYLELIIIHPFREGNGRSVREFIREYANSKSNKLVDGPYEFSWKNVDIEELHQFIYMSISMARGFKSNLELEFLKALEAKNTKLK